MQLPKDLKTLSPEQLHLFIGHMFTEFQKELKKKDEQIDKLTHTIALLNKGIFGNKNERFISSLTDHQLSLDLNVEASNAADGAEVVAITEPEAHKSPVSNDTPKSIRKPARGLLPSELPREEVVLQPKEITEEMVRIGEEITEVLCMRKREFFVKRFVRPKYATKGNPDAGIIIADTPSLPIPKGMADASLLAVIIIEKYLDHLPLYRQMARFLRAGIQIKPSTMNDWVRKVCNLLIPLYEAHTHQVLRSNYLMCDETTSKVLDRNKKGKTHQGYFWGNYDPSAKLVLFTYCKGRGQDAARDFFSKLKNCVVQSDGYAVYENFVRHYPDLTHAGCMAHARRYFNDARPYDEKGCSWMLTKIQHLYDIEKKARDNEYTPEARLELRKQYSQPILNEMYAWLKEQIISPGKKNPYKKAIAYMLNHWKELNYFCKDGRVEIDNNLMENKIRPITLGRKNFLFAGNHEAAQDNAMIYSLIGTCIAHDINPEEWLTTVLELINDWPISRIEELLPQNFHKLVRN
jgi:transposase